MIDPNKPIQIEGCDWQGPIPAIIIKPVEEGYLIEVSGKHRLENDEDVYPAEHRWIINYDGTIPFEDGGCEIKVVNVVPPQSKQ